MNAWNDLLEAIFILFAIVNPVGSIPIFLQLTSSLSPAERRKTFRTGVLAALVILLIFMLAGEFLLTRFFRIGMTDLLAAGGLLLLIIAIDHLVFGALVGGVTGKPVANPSHIGAVPIACPILAGPGAMMTVLVTYSDHGFVVAAGAVLAVMAITALTLGFIERIYGFLGEIVCMVLSKILALFIAAIGFHLLMKGIAASFLKG